MAIVLNFHFMGHDIVNFYHQVSCHTEVLRIRGEDKLVYLRFRVVYASFVDSLVHVPEFDRVVIAGRGKDEALHIKCLIRIRYLFNESFLDPSH
jgi:hypothetical protein